MGAEEAVEAEATAEVMAEGEEGATVAAAAATVAAEATGEAAATAAEATRTRAAAVEAGDPSPSASQGTTSASIEGSGRGQLKLLPWLNRQQQSIKGENPPK